MNIPSQRLSALTGSACLEKVISRLDKVKSAGASKWIACCPAHLDKSPSLKISETSDGVVLIKCWAGCSANEVVQAIGLQLRDLFPGNTKRRRGPSKAAIEHERMILQIGQSLHLQGILEGDDLVRFNLAKQRLGVK
ncbi:CHC2 zinc finger domain-containing protein [Pseudomonas putida]|uniref:Virulence-associated protein E n=1 Tax=Pseudomonas putida (strain W619) TaxID=390235 RepID=B1JDS7_PSEPW|nr:CHC2 zinc finger domain-containing protein [Pseudomonas putida]QQE83282.1 virulence-associated protein E [Pseudomonas putida]